MKSHQRAKLMTATLSAVVLLLAAPVQAAGPGGGGGGGGGMPEDGTGDIYADLVVAFRAADGTPILKKYDVPPTEEAEATTEYCVQPASYVAVPGVAAVPNPLDGRDVWVLPLQGEWWADPPDPLPVAEIETCDPQPQYAMFVSETELERLNLTRTSNEVIDRKVDDVETKLTYADEITLDGAGRITVDGVPIDAAPEHAGIYRSLTTTGTIPGLPAAMAGPPAQVGDFDAWELMAASLGSAASKTMPITVDTVEYYNRIVGFPPTADYISPWGIDFIRSEDPDNAGSEMTTGERFVDYNAFSYNRSLVFMGSITWLDVPTLTWHVERITDAVAFTNLTNLSDEAVDTADLTGVVAFAQLADDVRAVIEYLHLNEVIAGFYMDPVGVDTTAEQIAAMSDPAADLGVVPEHVFQTMPFTMTASAYNPWEGTTIDEARLRMSIDAEADLTAADVAAATSEGPVAWDDTTGDLVGYVWGTDLGTLLDPGVRASMPIELMIPTDAPLGPYTITLDLVDVDDAATRLATDTGTIGVNDDIPTIMWGGELPEYTTQGAWAQLPVQVYAPAADPTGTLQLTVTGPGDDPVTESDGLLQAGDVKVYGVTPADMVAMPMALDAANDALVGTWPQALEAGFTDVVWYMSVAEGAPAGVFQVDADITSPAGSAKLLEPALINVDLAEVHVPEDPGGKPASRGHSDEYTNNSPIAVSYAAIAPAGTTIERVELWVKKPGEPDFTKRKADVGENVDGLFLVSTGGVNGLYKFFTLATDSTGGVEDAKTVADSATVLDTVVPTVRSEKAAPSPFDISRDGEVTFSMRRSEKAYDSFVVKRDGNVVKRFPFELHPGGLVSETWLGRDAAGNKVTNGDFVIVMKAKDPAGNLTVTRVPLQVTR